MTGAIGAAVALIAGAALAVFTPASAQTMADAVAELRAQDTRLQSIGWRLAHGNAPFCPDAAPGAGLLLYDVRNFSASEQVRAALGITGQIAVGAVAAGSPAEHAGLRGNEEVIALGDEQMAALPDVPEGDTARVDGLHDRIDAALATRPALTVTTPRGTYAITGEPACRARFELVVERGQARSDGWRVQIGRDALDALANDDELAALMAHELAHAILRHRVRLDAARRTARAVRETEREADRLMPWLLRNAGYDPAAASRWVSGWLRKRDRGLLRAGTHDGWRDRLALVSAEVALVSATPGDGPIDWRGRVPAP